ncbi:MAG: hypothetical protein O9328_13665 [Rhodobacteraceae bacterium]|nr:hypothetical protein [Paracoccaceae bacterium]
MIVALPGQTPAILGFAFPAGLALALAAVLLVSYPPRVEVAAEEAVVEQEALTHLYIALEEPLYVSLGTGPRMKLDLAVSVSGTSAQLLELNAVVDDQLSRVRAAILSEAQEMVMEGGADSVMVHAALPERARDTINGMLGSEDFPEPVAEVLILGLALQE